MGGVLMGLRSALRLFRSANWFDDRVDQMVQATPAGAMRPTSTLWFDPGGVRPPVSWLPGTGEFETHWDWASADLLSIPGVWRARLLISQAIGQMPLGAFRGIEPVAPLPMILREPVPGEDRANTIAAWVCDLLDHGNAIGIIDDFQAGYATGITPVPCSEVAIGLDATGARHYQVGASGPVYDSSRVFHVKGHSLPGYLRGMGVLETQLESLVRMRAESDYASKAFSSGVPSGIIKVHSPDLDPGTVDDGPGTFSASGIKAGWKGSQRTGDVAVFSELIDFTPLSWTPSDAQMVEARQMSLSDVANIYNLDSYWLGAPSTSMPYQNVQQASVQLVRFTLEWPITCFEAQFSRLIPRGMDARFNRDTILRDDAATRWGTYKVAVELGGMTLDEVRADEGMRPLVDVNPAAPAPPASAVPGIVDPLPLFPAGDQASNAGRARRTG